MIQDLTAPNTITVTESENLYRALFDASPLMYFVLDEDGTVLSVSQNAIERLGYESSELVGKSVFDIFYEEDLPKTLEQIELLRREPDRMRQWEFRKVHKDGRIVYVSVNGRLLRQPTGKNLFLIICEDVTERKLAQDALLQSEARYRTLIENSAIILYALDPNGVVTLSEGAGLAKLGLKAGEVVGASVFELYRDYPRILQTMRRALNGENFSDENTINGLSLQVSHTALRDENGRFIGSVGVTTDVTELRRAETVMRDSEQRYRAFIEQSLEGIWRVEMTEPIPIDLPNSKQIELMYKTGFLAECNNAMARQYGFESGNDLTGKPLGEMLIHRDPASEAYLQAFIESGYRLTDAESHESDSEGRDKYFLNNLVGVVENNNLFRAWGTQRDITERIAAEQKKVEAVRQLETFVERDALINRITNKIRQSLKLEEVFQAIVNELGKHLAVSRCILYLFDYDKHQARAVASYINAPGVSSQDFHVPLTKTTVEALLKKDSMAFDDVAEEPIIRPLYEKVLRARDVKSLMCVGIKVGEDISGVSSFATSEDYRKWSEADI
ncbi:MAG TPA: PAS domain S-box protein, partial [Pyrinomonadaceae bacterium]|nr:PAS domain S-box protein [Pyrinomonadaceae bacterium]